MESLQLKINNSECPLCDKIFYEFDDDLLSECPHCEGDIGNGEMMPNVCETQILTLEIDPVTGSVKIPGGEAS